MILLAALSSVGYFVLVMTIAWFCREREEQ
jgi:hypothetical protein